MTTGSNPLELGTVKTDVEINSANARNKLAEIEQRLQTIKEPSNYDELIYFSRFYELSEEILVKLSDIDQKLALDSTKYKRRPFLRNLEIERTTLIDKLRRELMEVLKHQKQQN